MSPKKKLNLFSLIALYPLVSTFLMTMIWQIVQSYVTPLLGGYYFKWVFLYSENNNEWLSDSYLTVTRILYFVYLSAYLLLFILTLLVLFRRRGKAVCLWAICGLWIADGVWIIIDMAMTGACWQLFVLLGEHLLFLGVAFVFTLYYLKLKKEYPEWFKKKRRHKNVYRKRF